MSEHRVRTALIVAATVAVCFFLPTGEADAQHAARSGGGEPRHPAARQRPAASRVRAPPRAGVSRRGQASTRVLQPARQAAPPAALRRTRRPGNSLRPRCKAARRAPLLRARLPVSSQRPQPRVPRLRIRRLDSRPRPRQPRPTRPPGSNQRRPLRAPPQPIRQADSRRPRRPRRPIKRSVSKRLRPTRPSGRPHRLRTPRLTLKRIPPEAVPMLRRVLPAATAAPVRRLLLRWRLGRRRLGRSGGSRSRGRRRCSGGVRQAEPEVNHDDHHRSASTDHDERQCAPACTRTSAGRGGVALQSERGQQERCDLLPVRPDLLHASLRQRRAGLHAGAASRVARSQPRWAGRAMAARAAR